MNCIYKYKNKTFNSEMALNDYLLATETLKPVLGDLVYQLTEIQGRYAKNLKEAEKTYKDLKDRGIQIDSVKKEELEPDELDDVGSLKYPYISVTDLIHTMPSRYTDQAFPIFNSDNYWNHKFEDYKQGKFNVYELQFISDLVEQTPSGSIKSVSSQDTLNKIKERMEGVIQDGVRKGGLWQQQAMCGNMIHAMAALFYRQRIRENGPFLYQTTRAEIINWFKNNIDPQYKNYISKDIIESSVDRFIQLDKEIRDKWGKDAYVRTEQPIVGDLDLTLEGGQVTKVIGKIDLLVIGDDKHPGIGIIDYKCSPKDYTELNVDDNPFEYNSAKILTFKYQLATYRRILQSMNINPQKMELYVAPLKFEGFKMENGKVSFDSISSLGDKAGNTILQKLSNSDFSDERTNIESNLDRMFPKNLYIPAIDDIENILEDVQETMQRELPTPEKDTTEKGILELIKNNGGIRKNSATGEWEYRPRKNSDVGYRHYDGNLSEQEALVKLKEDLQKNAEYDKNYGINTSKSLREAYINYYHKDGDNPLNTIQSLAAKSSNKKVNATYLTSKMRKYSDTSIWEIVSEDNIDPILDQYGILLFRNKASGLIDIVKISNLYDPTQPVKLRKGKYLLGQFLKDDIAHSSADSLTMESTAGNIELIETMHVINRLHGIFKAEDVGIGAVKLLCPRQQTGLEPPNEQLLYNFDRLCKLDQGFKNNHFLTKSNQNGTIKMATYLDIVKQDAKEILKGIDSDEGFDKLAKDVKDSVSKIDFDLQSKEKMRDQLLSLDKKLVERYPYIQENIKEGQIESPESVLHKDLLYAIAELDGIKMQQQLRSSYQFHMSTKGISGTMADNPGTLQSHILNQATQQVTVAYQNVRDSIMQFDVELRKRLQKLKESKNFGWIQQNITGNQVNDLYKHMYDPNSQDFRFLNPWNPNSQLDDAEREFLKYALIKINSTRKDLNLEELLKNPDKMKDYIEQDDSYLLVPLTKGDFASEVATRGGIINYVEEKFKYIKAIWNSDIRQELKQKIDEKVTGLLGSDKTIRNTINNGAQWETVNSMHRLDLPENIEDRREKIQLVGGKDYFEHNLETILLKQHSNYKMAEELNKVFPRLQALAIHLNLQGAILNDKFANDLDYLFNYIKVRIHNQPFENREDASAAIFKDITDSMMKWSSRLALAFNPKQMYQFIDGIWKDIMLFTKDYKGGLGGQFSKDNLVSAWEFAMKDLGHFGDKLSLQESLNMQYGMNDMDMNVFIDRVKTDNTGLFTHFWDTGFRFASRPDYYNRMTIFVAQMKADGCFDAHVKKDGQWIYDWKLDKRFDEFAKAKGDINKATNKEKFNKQRSEYITIARQLVEEGARNSDGTLFEFDLNNPKPLPKAYTNQQSESMKALADRIYGYYAHEKKSMFNSTWVGSMLMQMNTFWSAKKNQYAQERSYTQEGYYVDYEEDGHKWYWKLDESGELIPVQDEDTGLPIRIWKGRPQEGILITLLEVAKSLVGKSEYTDKLGFEGYRELFNNLEPDVAKLYSANLRQLITDIVGMFIIGGLIGGSLTEFQKSYEKEHDNKYFGNAVKNSTLGLLTGMYTQSTEDFNGLGSLVRFQGRGPNWTPFSWTSISNVVTNWKHAIGGDQDFYDAIIKTASATKQTTPIWNYVKINTVGRKIGEKSKEE